MTVERIGTNSGHGHVWARPDGVRARCGGEALCAECRADMALVKSIPAKREVEKTPEEIIETLKRFGIDIAEFGLDKSDVARRMEAVRIASEPKSLGALRLLAKFVYDATEGGEVVNGTAAAEVTSLVLAIVAAAREWDKATFIPGFDIPDGPAAGLRRCVRALDEWERSL